MQIWPAIDLRGGNCVRLQQGDYGRETVFGDDPASMARHWVDQGGECLHLVDLDGARDGSLINEQAIRNILAAVSVPCELGGGIRDEQAIQRLLDLGLTRLVLGTKALKEPEWFALMAEKYPRKLVLGIDARNGFVATDGWLETSEIQATTLAQQFSELPIDAIVYTDIARDGMLNGPNIPAMQEMKQAVSCPIVASGGVSCRQDVVNLANAGLDACIVGRALYDDKVQLTDLVAIGKGAQKSSS
ncbi:MAG: 1-(5-phosphoribosyl)-5-[(5-phosphoribosylamino)methylideneamino]imidazole-4-carboxamide isomerase [Planctomycetales bacterium]|nr:1-(5-phosphoribosyl)-5-[(5-phosphoribosylamino)methylideneamino]imidazole-4-carboxamide isomerase [Planctomycetales bacterium]